MALTEITKRDMAQASGIFNVIRQIGGSFGVAILGTLLTQRTIFHTAAFSQAVDQNSPFFRQVITNIQNFSRTSLGSTSYDATTQAKSLIGANIANQAFVQAVNDCFLIVAIVTLVSMLPVFFLRNSQPRKASSDQTITESGTEQLVD
jgi:DHA2 family multidrug resistance protein